ncbi:oligosaccharide flippase family protein [Planktomarina temperata]|nr:oligosaccharide flippase family protein [Planktomarina temperata]
MRSFTSLIKLSGSNNVIANVGVLLLDRIVRLIGGFILTFVLVAFLEKSDFGAYSLAVAILSISALICELGLKPTIARLAALESGAIEKLRSAIILQVGATLIIYPVLIILALNLKTEPLLQTMLILLGLTLLFRPFYSPLYWFEGQVQLERPTLFLLANYIAFFTIKITLFYLIHDIIIIIILNLFEIIIGAAIILKLIKKNGLRITKLEYKKYDFHLVKYSYPYLISSVFGVLYLKIDQLMIGTYLGSEEVAPYALASRIVEVCFILPVLFNQTIRPSLIQKNANSRSSFLISLQKIVGLMIPLGFIITILVNLICASIFHFIPNDEYQNVPSLVLLLSLSIIPIYINNSVINWFIVSESQKYLVIRNIVGVVINIILNMIMIPILGLPGAAISTALARLFIAVFAHLIWSETRFLTLFILQSPLRVLDRAREGFKSR